MRKICISKDWYLKYGNHEDYINVDLPNDYSIGMGRNPNAPGGGSNGYFLSGNGRYVKYFRFDEPCHYILDIDGAYMCAEVTLNEELLVMHPHGYTPILVDLTDKVRNGHTNKLVITTKGFQCSTRWYSGAGIYRDVFLWTGGKVRVEPRDIFVTTPSVSEKEAAVRADYLLTADIDASVVVKTSIVDDKGNIVTKSEVYISVKKGEKSAAVLDMVVSTPKLWEVDSPNLYTLKTEILSDGVLTDTAETTFGIRSIEADAQHGLRLNGKPMKLRGGCIHHDHGVLGAAAFPAAEGRKVRKLKEAGFNALRIAHNPPSSALLEVCDRLGMIVMDEAFDMWCAEKNALDYHLWYTDWWQRDVSAMVLRDRNHPCVIAYSIGNEITEHRRGMDAGAKWARILANEIRKFDATRFVTGCFCGMKVPYDPMDPEDYKLDTLKGHSEFGTGAADSPWDEWTEESMAPLDIAGYNYLYQRYEKDHIKYPDRVIWGSETHVLNFYDSWNTINRCSFVLGDFTWTAYDNLGESGTGRALWARDGIVPGICIAPYPYRTCYQGDLDLCGYRRPQSYFRESVWIGNTEPRIFTTHPEHTGEGFTGTGWHWYDVLDTWTFEDRYLGKPVKADVYTDADEIVFLLNKTEVARAVPGKGIASAMIPYEKGELTAVAYKNGYECGRSSLHTVGKPAAVKVAAEKETFAADARDLCYFDITIVDADGDRVPDTKNELTCLVDGGELMGIFSGDPCNEDEYTTNRCHAFEGRALAIVRTRCPGNVTVHVGSNGLHTGVAEAKAE